MISGLQSIQFTAVAQESALALARNSNQAVVLQQLQGGIWLAVTNNNNNNSKYSIQILKIHSNLYSKSHQNNT
jgi:hypothetical protein